MIGVFMPTVPVWAAPPQADGPLLPMGGGYSDIYAGFSEAAVACARNGRVNIVVLPTAYSSNAEKITDAERARNLKDAEERRLQIEAACQRAAPPGVICSASIAPIFTRIDASDARAVAPLRAAVSAVFMLGGDQTIAMAALAGTLAEAALAAAHASGAVIAGTSAGGGMLSVEMLGGYHPNYAAGNSLDVGAADIWNSAARRGLSFGAAGVLLDQHFFQRGRLGRLLNAIATPGAPTLGVGIDAYTGVRIDTGPAGETLAGVFGLYEVAVLDAGTYHAAERVQQVPLEDTARSPVLSLRNVLVHLLAPGGFSYNLTRRQSSLAAPTPVITRAFETLRLPSAAGSLLLSGDLSAATADEPILMRFRELAGGSTGRVLVYADGYSSERSARSAGEKLAALLALPADVRTVSDAWLQNFGAYTGVVLIGRDQALVDVAGLDRWLPTAWRGGLPVLADNALAAVLGAYYAAHGPTPKEGEEAEFATQRSLRLGETVIKPGLDLVAATFEPQLLADNRWGRYFSLAYVHPELVAVGLNRGAGLEISHEGAWALGRNVTLTLDLRRAHLAQGTNAGFVIANGLLDVFGPGDEVRPQLASTGRPSLAPLPACHADQMWVCEAGPRMLDLPVRPQR